MKIRYKLLAGLLGVPTIFGVVTLFLIATNSEVQRKTQELVTVHAKLEVGAAKLSAALITGQKAAEELIAEKHRARIEPEEKEVAEKSASEAEQTIRKSQASVDEILTKLAAITHGAFNHARTREVDATAETEELESVAAIREEVEKYNLRMEKFLTTAHTQIEKADEVLNEEVEPEYEQRLLPLVQRYATARDEEVNNEASKIEQSVGRISRLITSAAIGALLLAILIALLLSHSFSQPLKKLATAATEIGKGRLGSRIQIESRDEIGLLARAFNQMAGDLSQTTVSKDYVGGIIKSMGDSLVVASSEGSILTVNAATCRMLGYTETELIGQPMQMLFANDDCEFLNSESRQDDIVSNVESTYLAKDGRGIPVAFSRTSMRLDAGEAPAVVCVAKDITELKLAAETVRQSEHKLSLHIQQTPLAVLEWNLNAEIVEWNPAAEAVFGYSKQEVLGRQITGLLTPESGRERAALEWNELLSEKVGKHVTHENLTKDGRTITCEWYQTPLDSEGRVIGVASMVQDFTERTEMEKDLKEMRDAALESVRLKSEFLANMSHEIRTPMNGVIGMTGLLLDTELNSDQREFAETIRSSGDALLTIINDILDFSKIEAGKLNFETLDFDLRNAIESTLELLAERAHGKRIELASLIFRDVPVGLQGDPGRLRQVLTNLVGNAIKFTELGEVVVRAQKEDETYNDVRIRFTVSDTGIGITEAAKKNLFQAFVQADGSTTRKYGGTGLGLAISKQLVELMGGEIGVTSNEGKGSTFWFTARFDKQLSAVVSPQPNLQSLRGLHALIVDDNATNRKILSHQLGSWEMTYEESDSGARALELLRSAAAHGAPYDLAVLDLMMPGMDGFELARTIKSDPLIAAVRLVLLTSYGQRGDGATAREAGIAAYLAKPIRQSQLFECLTSVISQSSLVLEPARTDKALAVVTKHSLIETRPMSNKLILLAEDNIVNQKVAVRQLKKLGYRADAVANGEEALEALGRIAYDLVLMDCQMPEMDGYEATAEIRRREGTTKHTPIVAMTAHALDGDREKCIAAGMDDYVSKPVKPEELARVLDRLLASADQANEMGVLESIEAAPPVDLERLCQAMADEPDGLGEILDIYLAQMAKNLKELDIAIKAGDARLVDLIAHKCGDTSANCGMTAVVGSLRELETMSRENRLTGASVLAAEVGREFERIKIFLQENLQPAAV
jgi:PAS domain S-box-containing protein